MNGDGVLESAELYGTFLLVHGSIPKTDQWSRDHSILPVNFPAS